MCEIARFFLDCQSKPDYTYEHKQHMKTHMILGAILLGGVALSSGCGSCKSTTNDFAAAVTSYSGVLINPSSTCDELESKFNVLKDEYNNLCDEQKETVSWEGYEQGYAGVRLARGCN